MIEGKAVHLKCYKDENLEKCEICSNYIEDHYYQLEDKVFHIECIEKWRESVEIMIAEEMSSNEKKIESETTNEKSEFREKYILPLVRNMSTIEEEKS